MRLPTPVFVFRLESNVGDGCNISAPNVLLDGLRIVDYKHDGRAVRLHATAVGAVVRGTRSGGNGNYSDHYNTILVEGLSNNSDMFAIDGNFNMCVKTPIHCVAGSRHDAEMSYLGLLWHLKH